MDFKKEQIKIALVICTYNRDKYLPDALLSIKNQTVHSDYFQVLVVDNNSTDKTEIITKEFIINNPSLNIQYIFEKQKGLSFARNRGMREALAPIIAYIDDDVILPPNYLTEIIHFFETFPIAAGAGGKVIPKYENDKEPPWMNKYLNGFIGKIDYGNQIKKFGATMKYPAGCNMIYKKQILLGAGGFNNELTFRSDDKDIFIKVQGLSDEIYYLPDAFVYHNIDEKRLEYKNFKKLFLKTGNEEKKRMKSEKGIIGMIKKFIEYVFKCGASFLLFIGFSLKGEFSKGKYILASQWYTLQGFLQKEVFVR